MVEVHGNRMGYKLEMSQLNDFQPLTKEFLLGSDCMQLSNSKPLHQPNTTYALSTILGNSGFSAGVFTGHSRSASELSFNDHFSIVVPQRQPVNKPTTITTKTQPIQNEVSRSPSPTPTAHARAAVLRVAQRQQQRQSAQRKRPTSKREPLPEEFSDQEEYDVVWSKWREDRDHNNRSVKRSRQRAKQKKLETLNTSSKYCGKSTKFDNHAIEIDRFKSDLKLMVMLNQGQHMTKAQNTRAELLIDMYSNDDASTSSGSGMSNKSENLTGQSKRKTRGKKSRT